MLCPITNPKSRAFGLTNAGKLAGGAADVLLLLLWVFSLVHLTQVVPATADSFDGPDQSG